VGLGWGISQSSASQTLFAQISNQLQSRNIIANIGPNLQNLPQRKKRGAAYMSKVLCTTLVFNIVKPNDIFKIFRYIQLSPRRHWASV
jgi:hypothetical protein